MNIPAMKPKMDHEIPLPAWQSVVRSPIKGTGKQQQGPGHGNRRERELDGGRGHIGGRDEGQHATGVAKIRFVLYRLLGATIGARCRTTP